MTAVRAGAPGLSAAKQQLVILANGTVSGGRRIGGQTVFTARGVLMAGPGSRRTGSTFPVALSLIIPFLIGTVSPAGGVTRSRSSPTPPDPGDKSAPVAIAFRRLRDAAG